MTGSSVKGIAPRLAIALLTAAGVGVERFRPLRATLGDRARNDKFPRGGIRSPGSRLRRFRTPRRHNFGCTPLALDSGGSPGAPAEAGPAQPRRWTRHLTIRGWPGQRALSCHVPGRSGRKSRRDAIARRPPADAPETVPGRQGSGRPDSRDPRKRPRFLKLGREVDVVDKLLSRLAGKEPPSDDKLVGHRIQRRLWTQKPTEVPHRVARQMQGQKEDPAPDRQRAVRPLAIDAVRPARVCRSKDQEVTTQPDQQSPRNARARPEHDDGETEQGQRDRVSHRLRVFGPRTSILSAFASWRRRARTCSRRSARRSRGRRGLAGNLYGCDRRSD